MLWPGSVFLTFLPLLLFSERWHDQPVARQPYQHASGLPGRDSEVGCTAPICARGGTGRQLPVSATTPDVCVSP